MAIMAAVPVERDVVVDILPPQRPQQAHVTYPARAERAALTPVPELPRMPEIRNRGHGTPLSRLAVQNDESSSDSSQTLTPTSIDEQEQVSEFNRLLASAKTASWNLLTKVTPSRPTAEEIKEFDQARGYNNFKYERVDDYPEGYPQLAAFINSDDTFLNFRRFRRIAARVLLHLQTELTDLEAKLDKLDLNDAANRILEKRLRGYKDFPGYNTDQQELLSQIQTKWMEYAAMMLKISEVEALGQAPTRNYLSIFNWVWERNPLGRQDFIFHADDFVSLVKHSQKDRRVKNFIESWLDSRPQSLFRTFLRTKKEIDKTDDEYVDHYSPARLEILANCLAVSAGTGILLIPVFLLFLVQMSRVWMCVTASLFVIVFTVLVSTATGAKAHEIFFGLAAYSAVLFIFLGNMNENGVGVPK